MPTFAPTSATVVLSLLLAAAVCVGAGYLLQRTRSRWLAWSWLLGSILIADRALRHEGAGLRMVSLVAVTLYGMKALVGVEHHRSEARSARRSGSGPLPLRDWLAFAVIWLGMQPREFRTRSKLPFDRRLLVHSLAWMAAGAATIALARAMPANPLGTTPHLCAYTFLLGCSMITHFGIIGLIVVALRRFGYAVSPQFRAPWLANNLQDFWTRRWNIGFSVMTTIAIYRPLAPVVTRRVAMFAAFVASGLLHEVACSLPVDGGFALPTLYFVMHGLAMATEHGLTRRGMPLTGVLGRVWVYAWVLLPAPLVFHDAFLRGIIVPLL